MRRLCLLAVLFLATACWQTHDAQTRIPAHQLSLQIPGRGGPPASRKALSKRIDTFEIHHDGKGEISANLLLQDRDGRRFHLANPRATYDKDAATQTLRDPNLPGLVLHLRCEDETCAKFEGELVWEEAGEIEKVTLRQYGAPLAGPSREGQWNAKANAGGDFWELVDGALDAAVMQTQEVEYLEADGEPLFFHIRQHGKAPKLGEFSLVVHGKIGPKALVQVSLHSRRSVDGKNAQYRGEVTVHSEQGLRELMLDFSGYRRRYPSVQ